MGWWRVLAKCGPLEKGMADHFSIPALRTPWMYTPVVDSCWCMAKPIQCCKVKNNNNQKKKFVNDSRKNIGTSLIGTVSCWGVWTILKVLCVQHASESQILGIFSRAGEQYKWPWMLLVQHGLFSQIPNQINPMFSTLRTGSFLIWTTLSGNLIDGHVL